MRIRTDDTDLTIDIQSPDTGNILGVELLGVADIANHTDLEAALSQVDLNGADHVCLQLTRLTFCDTSALSHIIAFAVRVQQRGQHITTLGASRTIRKMTHILGVNRELNLA